MALAVGSRLGHYDVTALIGEGGMGQVYQATDTKLNRQVALKILPEAFATDPDRLARFQREAQVLASLNHPGIAAIYGLEDSEGTKALVLELVEGPTLADRIAQGPIPVDEALPIAKQIAEALEAAHEAGVIHRDLKPANIKVKDDGTVKVLDFGLAKALDTTPQGDPSQSPTLTAAATQMGMVLGTAAYMAPEQAKGKVVDKRADVWAFGAVLYEMLTGQKPFTGDDVSTTLARVIEREPNWNALPSSLSPVLATYLRRCLAKEPKQRVHDMADVRLALEGAFETATSPLESVAAADLKVWQRPVPVAVALVGAVAIGGLAVWTLGPAAPADLMRFAFVLPETAPLSLESRHQDVAIFPDGSQVVYVSRDSAGGAPQLHVRPFDQLDGTPLRGTAGGVAPFVSPDGAWVGFTDTAGTTLQKVSVAGGLPVTLWESETAVIGASWGADDQIIVGTSRGLFRVPANGDEPEVVTSRATEQGQHLWPSVLPDVNAVLFVTASPGPPLDTGELAILSLDTGEVTRLGLAGTSPHFVSTGHLVYAGEDGSVRAVRFDPTRLEVSGNPVPVVENVVVKLSGAANFSVSRDGSLVYVASGGEGSLLPTFAWVDREGREEAINLPPNSYGIPRLSPDGTRVAVQINDPDNIDVSELARRTLTKVTTDSAADFTGVWSPDGERVVFTSLRDDGPGQGLFWRAFDGTGPVEQLMTLDAAGPLNAYGWSPDGTRLVFAHGSVPGQGWDIGVLLLDGDHAWEPLIETEANERRPALSTDGNWIAYMSDETGQDEIYVQRFPALGQKQQISISGGTRPQWAHDGHELFYAKANALMAVPIEPGPTLQPGTPELLFQRAERFENPGLGFEVSPDDQRFLILQEGRPTNDGVPQAPEITVVLNWFKELKERVPVD